MPLVPTAKLELEVSTGVWTDLLDDVIRDPIVWEGGIRGFGPLDRLGGPGSLQFTLDNTELNSASTAGLYSPGGPSALSGFQKGKRVRIHLDDGAGNARYWLYYIDLIDPEPNITGLRATVVHCVDWLAFFAGYDAANLSLRQSVRSDELVTDLVDAVPTQPANRDFDVGQDTYEFAFDDLGGSVPKATEVAHDIVMSELGYLYLRGDATDGETLRFENRHARALASVAATFTGDELENDADALAVVDDPDLVFNDIEALGVPRRVDAPGAETVVIREDAPIKVGPGDTETIFVDYQDPNNEAEFVGVLDPIDPPVTPDDWLANTAQDGTGTDVSGDFSVAANFWAPRAKIDLTNNGGVEAWLRGPAGGSEGIQARGRAIRRYRPIARKGQDPTSIGNHGSQQLPSPLLMPYQSDLTVVKGAAEFLAHVYSSPHTPTAMKLPSELGDSYLAHGINLDTGDLIEVTESQTGLVNAGAHIHHVHRELHLDGRLHARWILAPADTTNVWIWNTASYFNVNRFGYV